MTCYKDFRGKVIYEIKGLEVGSEKVEIVFTDGSYVEMWHEQDCCENVEVIQVDNDVSRHIGAVIECINEKVNDEADRPDEYTDSATETFYDIVTSKGYLSFRWLGTSNGYYSETVSIKYYPVKTDDKLIFKQHIPLTGFTTQVNTVSFDDSTKEEMFNFFTTHIEDYRKALERIRNDLALGQVAMDKYDELKHTVCDLEQEVEKQKAIISYLEGRHI